MLKRIIYIVLTLIFFSQSCFAHNIVLEKVTEEERTALGGMLNEEGELIEVEPGYSVGFYSDLSFDEYVSQYVCSDEDVLPEEITGLDTYKMELSEFRKNYYYTVMKHPEMLAITGYRSIKYSEIEGRQIVSSVEPIYLVSGAQAAREARTAMNQAVTEYIELANDYDTDLEKLIVIHDKMVADCVYDFRVQDETQVSTVPYTVYHALGVLRDKFAVCQGYSQALYMIAKELDIELDFCSSEERKHMWNFVELDGKWYHMDMTNDDPADAEGRAYHTYFLVSESGLSNDVHGDDWCHYGGGETYKCTDTKYETDHLFNMAVPFTAKRADDGYFHVPLGLNIEAWGVSTTVDFKSETLYTGPVVSQYFVANATYISTEGGTEVESTTRNLYFTGYATKNLDNIMQVSRYDNKNGISVLSGFSLSAHEMQITQAATGVPENLPISFTGFFWNKDTLIPYSEKTLWSQK